MIEWLTLLLAAFAGLSLGAVFFGGLWWTVRKAVVAKHPALWFLGSLIVRMGIVMFGFYLVGGGQWQRWLSCLVGFILARFLVTWLSRPALEVRLTETKEAHHAT